METLIREILDTQRAMQKSIRQIELELAEKRGERRVGLWVAGITGTAASAIITFAFKYIGTVIGRQP